MQERYSWNEGAQKGCPFHARALCVESRCPKGLSFPCKSVIRGKKVPKRVVLSTQMKKITNQLKDYMIKAKKRSLNIKILTIDIGTTSTKELLFESAHN